MDTERAGRIRALAARLEEEDVQWDEVEDYVADFPGWRQFVELLREPNRSAYTRAVQMDNPTGYMTVPKETRLRLLEFFLPFALILEAEQTPAAHALRLRDAGVDVMAFCKEHRRDGIPEIAAAADAVYEACKADKTLLRASSAPVAPNELLRSASAGETASDALLRPSDTPDETPAPRPTLLQRLFSRRNS